MVKPEPVTAPPVRPPSRAPGRAAVPAQAAPPQVTAAAQQVEQPAATLLTNLLTNNVADDDGVPAEAAPGRTRTAYGSFMGIQRSVDPFRDLAQSGTRLPKFVVAAVTLIRNATGRTQQDIIAKALTGEQPLPAEVLDAAFFELYGYDRPRR